MRMQLDLIDSGILDYNFFWWTVNKGYATLRASQKKNRPKQELVSTLHSFSVAIPDRFDFAVHGFLVLVHYFVLQVDLSHSATHCFDFEYH